MSKESQWKVTIETRGQAGIINYTEEKNIIKFNWEFGAHDIIAFIWKYDSEQRDKSYPWAVGRKKEILKRVAEEVIKQRAQNCRAEIEYERTTIKIVKQ